MAEKSFDKPISVSSTKPNPGVAPNLPQVNSIRLSEGPRAIREVVHYPIYSENTGEFKGHQFTFRSRHKAGGAWKTEPAKSFTLSGDDEIFSVIRFVTAACDGTIPNLAGKSVLLPTPHGTDAAVIQRALGQLSQDGKAHLLFDLLGQLLHSPKIAESLAEQASLHPQRFAGAAAAINLARYKQSYQELLRLIDESAREQDFQNLLSRNPWMFGSEYSELLGRREFTRGAKQDFVLRRTTDGFMELIEIKTPLDGAELFRFDDSHGSYYASSALSKVVGQVQNYLENLDASRYEIRHRDDEDTNKIRAKIIIGRDRNKHQVDALRRSNGHLHRIEILTFDQLCRVANQVLSYLEELVPVVTDLEPDDDIPF